MTLEILNLLKLFHIFLNGIFLKNKKLIQSIALGTTTAGYKEQEQSALRESFHIRA